MERSGAKIKYIYDATGVKLQKIATTASGTATITNYCGEMEFIGNSLNLIHTDEGTVTFDPVGLGTYQYFLKDHLGNTRVVIDQAGTITQKTDYYPFGGISWMDINNPANKYLYNGKEKQDEFGLDWYDYGARFYDPQIGRFITQDRFAEKYISMTPYQYGANNPIVYIDVNGDSLKVTNDAIMAIYHSLDKNSNVHFDVKNGMINPESFKEQAENSNDIVLKDLYEVAINKQIAEMSVAANYDYKDKNGEIRNSDDKGDPRRFNAPYDYNTNEDPLVENTLKRFGEPTGKTFIGNTGRTLFPGNNSITGANSTNNNIQIILNAKGNANHRAAGSAHELVHVILHFRSGGKVFQHGQPGVQSEIDKRSSIVIKRLGYDFY